jgi:enoyl-CoA hydratase/carnithine racemase
MYRELLYEVRDPAAIITLNRPERLNALTGRLLAELKHAIAEAERDERVVGIVLTGAGRGFSAGADMQDLQNTAQGSRSGSTEPPLESSPGDPTLGPDFQVTYGYLLAVRKPLLAAINGPCAGLGFVIAMLCDLRFASENATFTTAFANRGLIAEHGVSWILPRLIGPSRALDILWSGRKFDAAEADRLGILNRLLPHGDLLPASLHYIEELATRSSPTSIMIMKQQVYKHLMTSLGKSLEETNALMAESLRREDFKEGVTSYLEKRPPRFRRVSQKGREATS